MSDVQTDEGAVPPEPESTSETVRLYSNYAAVSATPEEVILRFCQRDMKDPNRVIEIARVFLSLPHAKRLVIAMGRSLKSYEEIFGEVPADPVQTLTPEVRKKLGVTDSKEK